MPYSYPFINAGNYINSKTPKQVYSDLFQATLDQQFYNASNVYLIQEETALASGIYQNVDVRISSLVDPTTGDNVEDDFKKLTFKEVDHSIDLGRMYQFNNNYWLTVNVDRIKTLVQTATVRRCNNSLRWYDSDGSYNNIPCAIKYLVKENRDYSTAGSAIVVPSGVLEIDVQINTATKKIQPNQRFLFGNQGHWTSYRVEGGGINNFNNLNTLDNNSGGFMRLTLVADYTNYNQDDLINGIANYYDNIYTLTLSSSSISGDITQQVQLFATVKLNGQTITEALTWSSDDVTIATVDSSGLVTFVAEGSAVITCALTQNQSISDTCNVTVGTTPEDNYQVVLSPNINYILETQTQVFNVNLYLNGTIQVDTFTFTLNPNTVPSNNYIYTVLGGNSFSIVNVERYLTDHLTVTATSGSHVQTFNVSLNGAW